MKSPLASPRFLPLFLLLPVAFTGAACSESEDEGDPAPPMDPEFSFIYCSDRTGSFELFQRTGTTDVQLTDDATVDSWWPRISPDGTTVLFYQSDVADRPATGAGNNNYAHASLWMLDRASGVLTERIPKGAMGWTTQGVADWSPDGTQIVMAAESPPNGRWDLFISDATAGGITQITTRDALYIDPSWSPDGTRICCAAFPTSGVGGLENLEIYAIDADGTNELRLTTDGLRDHDPYWSPDGTEIMFETDVDPTHFGIGRWALRGVAPDGTSLRTLIDDGNINTLPQWSADGATVYFQRFVFGGPGQFRIAEVPSTGTPTVTYLTEAGPHDDTDIALFQPGISPRRWDSFSGDGRWIVEKRRMLREERAGDPGYYSGVSLER